MNRSSPRSRKAPDLVPLNLLDETAFEPEETGAVPLELCEDDLFDEPPAAQRGTALGAVSRRPLVLGSAGEEDRLCIVRPEEWCRVCGTRHEPGDCPGELLATGPERHGWRATYETPRGTRETHAVLVAPASGRWRARIMTYPRALWTLPGCPRTIKFVADHPREAERHARELIEDHCGRRQCRRIEEEVSKLEISSFDREAVAARSEEEAARRRPRALPVRFAAQGQSMRRSNTTDLSEHGLFIATDHQHSKGTSLSLVLELPGASVPLRGLVRWTRAHDAPGRPAGIGVLLSRVPGIYLHYVRSLP